MQSLTFYFDFRAFQGGGFKLGSDTVASAAVSAEYWTLIIFKESIVLLFFIQSKNNSRWEFPEEQRPSPRSGILSSKCRIFLCFTSAALSYVEIRWRDGFSIDGGELRHYSDPGSREFMVRIKIAIEELQSFCLFQASVMRGSIPAELVKEAKGGEVHVDMEDHR